MWRCCAGLGDSESVAAVQERAHGHLPREEDTGGCRRAFGEEEHGGRCRCAFGEEETEGFPVIKEQEEIGCDPVEEEEREGLNLDGLCIRSTAAISAAVVDATQLVTVACAGLS